MNSPSGVKLKPGDVPFSLRLNSWMQFRHAYFDSDGPNPDENDLEFERLRLNLLAGDIGWLFRTQLQLRF